MRVKRGPKRTKRRKKILKQAKGYYGGKSRNFRVAKEAVERSLQFAYRDRRNRKRDFRRLWIVRINAGARLNGLSYNRFMHGLREAGCELNRKMLADLAVRDPEGFAALARVARKALGMADVAQEPAPAESAAAATEEAVAEEPAEAAEAEDTAADEPEPAEAVAEATDGAETAEPDSPKSEEA